MWARLAFWKFAAAISTLLYWITNPLWTGGSLAFISAATWNAYIPPLPSASPGDFLFKIVFVWLAIATAIVGLQHGKKVLAAGAVDTWGINRAQFEAFTLSTLAVIIALAAGGYLLTWRADYRKSFQQAPASPEDDASAGARMCRSSTTAGAPSPAQLPGSNTSTSTIPKEYA